MQQKSIPPGMVEIAVPEGVFIGSIENRLDRFMGACMSEHFNGQDRKFEGVREAWEELSEEEKRELGLQKYFRQEARARWIRFIVPGYQVRLRKQLALEMHHRACDLRALYMWRPSLRPRHRNPHAVLIRR